MADYSQVNDYSEKDALATGDPLKLIKGSDIDADLAAISSAVASKFDSTDIATAGEAQAGVDNTKVITPARLTAWGQNGAGVIEDLQALADPDADRGLMWDDSAGATVFMTFGSGITITDTTISVNEADFARLVTAGNGLAGGGSLAADITLDLDYINLTGAVIGAPGDLISFGDESDSDTVRKATFAELEAALTTANMIGGIDATAVTITAGVGLSYSVGGTDLTTDATIDLDINALTEELTIDAANDNIVFYDASASVERKVPIDSIVGTELGDGKWYCSTDQAISTTEVTVDYDTAVYDSLTRGTFDTSTGEYTVGASAARLLVACGVRAQTLNEGQSLLVKIQQQGSNRAQGDILTYDSYGAIPGSINLTTVISAAAGDVIRVRAATSNSTDSLEGSASWTYVSIVELG